MSLATAWRTSQTVRIVTPLLALAALSLASARFATVVPNEVMLPGTQPLEVGAFDPSFQCEICHGQYDPAVEPFQNWSGSMMAHAGRDPLFWAALAITEQEFDGAGDLCLRCHAPLGWYDGRSTPTDGSSLAFDDFDGVSCDFCHHLVNPDDSEHLGAQTPPFLAHDGGNPPSAYRGSGEAVLWGSFERLGPYSDPLAVHGWMQSQFHRSSDLCGTCHDVSNPVTGDLAPNNGAFTPLAPGTFDGTLGGPLANKAALNNAPHNFGVAERTFSEHLGSAFANMPVIDFRRLPVALRKGALADTYWAALAGGQDGNYADGTQRNYTCQSCHMAPVTGAGSALLGSPVRSDLPLHDMTGGNYWAPDAILYLDALGRLRGGNGLTPTQIAGIQAGKLRALERLEEAATLSISGNTVRVTNLTGHKLITGYPEGRRMWLNVEWFDASGALVREDGAWGPLNVTVNGTPYTVASLLPLNDPNTKVYEAHMAITQDWAVTLLALGVPGSLVVEYDRLTGAPSYTLGQIAAQAAGTTKTTFHFALNNTLESDNRIPPYQMSRDMAFERNAQPIPPTQYGNPAAGGVYDNWDDVTLNPPAGAVSAEIKLMYQPTSWEYVQFLVLANDGTSAFLGSTGDDLFEAWRNTAMAAPAVMAETVWGAAAPITYCTAKLNSLGCTPQIAWSGAPSSLDPEGFYITCSNALNNQFGMLYYSVAGPNAAPFKGGTKCVANPVQRTGIQSAFGEFAPVHDCSGGYVLDFNKYIAAGSDPALVGGTTVWAQWWMRDGGSAGSHGFSDALQFTIE